MRKILQLPKMLVLLLVFAGCLADSGRSAPPVSGEGAILVDTSTQKVSLDTSKVPFLAACSAGQFVRKSGEGWECAAPDAPSWSSITDVTSATPWPGTVPALEERVALLEAATDAVLRQAAGALARIAALEAATDQFYKRLVNKLELFTLCGFSQDGLAAYLRLNGNFVDVSGNNQDGVGVGGPTFVPGKFEDAVSFNGTSQFVELQNSAELHMSSGLTISAWVKFSNVAITSERPVVAKHYSTMGGGYFLAIQAGGTPSFYKGAPGALIGGTAIGDNSWHHMAGTWDGTSESLYVDGSVAVSRRSTVGLAGAGVTVKIGALDNSPTKFPGAVDVVTLWSRALSQPEIEKLMACR